MTTSTSIKTICGLGKGRSQSRAPLQFVPTSDIVTSLRTLAGQCGSTGAVGHFFLRLSNSSADVELRTLFEERSRYDASLSTDACKLWLDTVGKAVDAAVDEKVRMQFLGDKFITLRLVGGAADMIRRAVIAAAAVTSISPEGQKWSTKDHRAHIPVVKGMARVFQWLGVRVVQALFGEAVRECVFRGTSPQLVAAFDKAQRDQGLHTDSSWTGLAVHLMGTAMGEGEGTDVRAWRPDPGIVAAASPPAVFNPGDILIASTDCIHRGRAACPYSARVFQIITPGRSSGGAGSSSREAVEWNVDTSVLPEEVRGRWQEDGFRFLRMGSSTWTEEGEGSRVSVSIMNGDDAGVRRLIE